MKYTVKIALYAAATIAAFGFVLAFAFKSPLFLQAIQMLVNR